MYIKNINNDNKFYTASLTMFFGSAAFAWPSPALPILLADNSPIPITSSESGWIVLVMLIGRLASVVPGSWAIDK